MKGQAGAGNKMKTERLEEVATLYDRPASLLGGSTKEDEQVKKLMKTCSGCNKLIKKDKYLLKACEKYWHENCLRCDKCHRKLGELGPSLFCKSNMNLCQRDYLE